MTFDHQLYVVSDQVAVLKKALDAGVKIIQLRDKHSSREIIRAKAWELMAYKPGRNFVFILNDDPELALEVKADGVHIGQDTTTAQTRKLVGDKFIIGKSTHNLEQGLQAQAEGVDYISVGPVFATPTKPGRPAVGLEYVRQAARQIRTPFVAIGGIDLSNIDVILEAGAKTIAVVRAAEEAALLIKKINDAYNN